MKPLLKEGENHKLSKLCLRTKNPRAFMLGSVNIPTMQNIEAQINEYLQVHTNKYYFSGSVLIAQNC
jgi:hypothetical protein